jgi:hypothetical protein
LASTRIREKFQKEIDEILRMEDTKRLGPFRGVPLQAGEVPHFRDLTPVQEEPHSSPSRLKRGILFLSKDG